MSPPKNKQTKEMRVVLADMDKWIIDLFIKYDIEYKIITRGE